MKDYVKPTITEIGSLQELTLVGNKTGKTPDIYSSSVPIVGSIGPVGPHV